LKADGNGSLSPHQRSDNPAIEGIRESQQKIEAEDKYRFDPLAYIHDKLNWLPWQGEGDSKPGQVEVVRAYEKALRQLHEKQDWELGKIADDDLKHWTPGEVIKNFIRIEAGHTVGKTKMASGIFSHFFDCFPPAIVYTFAPSWDQIAKLLWKEIKTDRKANQLPGRILEDCEIKTGQDNWFAIGRATNDAGGKGTERIHGQHGAYLMFIVDEAEGVADYVFNAIDSMASGGIAIVILLANPRTRTSKFHKLRTRSNVKSFRISCLHHPNVVAGREVVTGAVKRDYVTSMAEDHCEAVEKHNTDLMTFTLPYPVAKNGVLLPAGTIYEPDNEFCFRVLGVAPANSTSNTFVPVGRYEAAKSRKPETHEPDKLRIGVDCARYGDDYGTVYVKWNGKAWRSAYLSKQDSFDYRDAVKKVAIELHAQGARYLHVRVDGGGGFGAGVIDLLKRDGELKELFTVFRVLEVHNNAVPHDEKSYKNLVTEMYAESAESLKGLALINPPEHLETDLCERTFEIVNVKGVEVKQITPKEKFKKDNQNRSPDDGDGFVLAVSPDFLFGPTEVLNTIRPANRFASSTRR
jgi:hypothetical protein